MPRDVELACRCGAIEGRVAGASPRTVNRVVCYCDDCQAFVHRLGRADILNPKGGTDIVQVAPRSLSFHRGGERIVGMRLTPKGLYRWYAPCCSTPLGNTVTPGIPFVGIVARVFERDGVRPDDVFGEPIGAIGGKFAVGGPPEGSGFNVSLIARAVRLVLTWKLEGKVWPHPFFDRTTRLPTRPLTILSRAERDALRPLCGPNPAAPSAA